MENGQTLEEKDCRYSSYRGKGVRLLHWGPLLAIGIITWISSFTVYCDLMYWPLHQNGGLLNLSVFLLWSFYYGSVYQTLYTSIGGMLNLSVFLLWVSLVFYHHYQAAAIGPGFVPYCWRSPNEDDYSKLQFCHSCNGYKAPRSHHCRKCNRCVMKMDHHCPWINTCCGHMNHANFTYFLFFAPIGCVHAFYILVASIYYGINIRWYLAYGTGNEPRVMFGVLSLIGSMFAVGLAFGVALSVGLLFIMQIKSIIRNKTGIEEWIEQKAEYRALDPDEKEFVYPYDLGCRRNMLQVLFTPGGWPKSNGFWWDVSKDADQFTMTIEQMKQKEEKRLRARDCHVIKSFSGWCFPLTHGLCVCCCFPWSDEPRIKLSPGDVVTVTRWRKHWLYGDKHLGNDGDIKRVRGWFPRHCVSEDRTKSSNQSEHLKSKND